MRYLHLEICVLSHFPAILTLPRLRAPGCAEFASLRLNLCLIVSYILLLGSEHKGYYLPAAFYCGLLNSSAWIRKTPDRTKFSMQYLHMCSFEGRAFVSDGQSEAGLQLRSQPNCGNQSRANGRLERYCVRPASQYYSTLRILILVCL